MPESTDDTPLITILLVIIGAVIIFPMGFGMMGFRGCVESSYGDGIHCFTARSML